MSESERARERAVRFIERHGDELQRLAVAVLGRAEPVRRVHVLLEQRQRRDGAFSVPARPAGAALAETRRVLGLLDDLRALDGPVVERASAYLERVQASDGHWGEGESEAERLFETGMLAGHLAKSTCARARMLEAAADYLASRWSPERLRELAWEGIAAYAQTFANLPHERCDEVLQWCGRELERGFRDRRFDAVRTARVLAWCDAPTLPGARLTTTELVAAIVDRQAEDGGWLAPDLASTAARVAHTFDALVGLLRLSADAGPRRGDVPAELPL